MFLGGLNTKCCIYSAKKMDDRRQEDFVCKCKYIVFMDFCRTNVFLAKIRGQ
uniref:Uncharacterized protein n=1 Tax=Anguilla anguilla TaxID=7936 RepID=A0A0E9SL36_ANGAN